MLRGDNNNQAFTPTVNPGENTFVGKWRLTTSGDAFLTLVWEGEDSTLIGPNMMGGIDPGGIQRPFTVDALGRTDGFIKAMCQFTRPADTTAYASGDLVANSTTNGDLVMPVLLNAALMPGVPVKVSRIRIAKSGNTVTDANFQVHLFEKLPVIPTAADNTALTSGTTINVGTVDYYAGSVNVPSMIAGVAGAVGFSTVSPEIILNPFDNTGLYVLLEAKAAYVPASEEIFTVTLEGFRS
jgi:hypothetical protein